MRANSSSLASSTLVASPFAQHCDEMLQVPDVIVRHFVWSLTEFDKDFSHAITHAPGKPWRFLASDSKGKNDIAPSEQMVEEDPSAFCGPISETMS